MDSPTPMYFVIEKHFCFLWKRYWLTLLFTEMSIDANTDSSGVLFFGKLCARAYFVIIPAWKLCKKVF